MSLRLSVVIITRNAGHLLADCLASVRWADEIVVLDSGSQDDTLAIARDAGAQVAVNGDWQGYGIQRQRAQRLATGDYVLMLDADERVTPQLADSIRFLLKQPQVQRACVYRLQRSNLFLDRFMRHSGWYPDRVVRLYARADYQYNDHLVHESLVTGNARVVELSGDLQHFTCCDLMDFQQKQLAYASAWAREQYGKQRRVSLAGVFARAMAAFAKTLLWRAGWLDGQHGWLLAVVSAQYTFNKYAALWALNRARSKQAGIMRDSTDKCSTDKDGINKNAINKNSTANDNADKKTD